ncbi:hypothetical protein NPIL_668831 [Nephila pilipes]|uniref:Uncharacterized protein n=1 Tax=Nephila pilipes TaxID=299642 RepID=A0A8X6TPQ9_NEPPI|nr:hypothetical protein NPIL_668831 [Nephila pilipes]
MKKSYGTFKDSTPLKKALISDIEDDPDSPGPLELMPEIHLTKDAISEDKIEMGKKASIDEAGGDEREESLSMQHDCLSYDEPPHLSPQCSLENSLLQQTPTYSQNRPENIYEDTAEGARSNCGDFVSSRDYDCSKDYVETSHLLSQLSVKHLPSQLQPSPASYSTPLYRFKSVSEGIDEKDGETDNASEYNFNKHGTVEESHDFYGRITHNRPEKGTAVSRVLKPIEAFECLKAEKRTKAGESEKALDEKLSFTASKRSSSPHQISKDEFPNASEKLIDNFIVDTWLHTEKGYVKRISHDSPKKSSPSTKTSKDISPSYSMKTSTAETSKSNFDLNLEMKDSQEKSENVYAKPLARAIFKESCSSLKSSESYFSSSSIISEGVPHLQSPQSFKLSAEKIYPQTAREKEDHHPDFVIPDQSSLSFKTPSTSFTSINSGAVQQSKLSWNSTIPAERRPPKTDLEKVYDKSPTFTTPYQTSPSSQTLTNYSAKNIVNRSTSFIQWSGVSNNLPERKIPQAERGFESCNKYLTFSIPKRSPQSSKTYTDNSSISVISAEQAYISKLSKGSNISSEERSPQASWKKEASDKHESFATLERLSPSFKMFAEDSSQGFMNLAALSLSQSSEDYNVSREMTPRKPRRRKCRSLSLSILTHKRYSPYSKSSTDDSSSCVTSPEDAYISKLSRGYSIPSDKRSLQSTWEKEASAKHQSFATLERLSPSFKTYEEDDSSLSFKNPEALSLSQSSEILNVPETNIFSQTRWRKVRSQSLPSAIHKRFSPHSKTSTGDSMSRAIVKDPVHSPLENVRSQKTSPLSDWRKEGFAKSPTFISPEKSSHSSQSKIYSQIDIKKLKGKSS